MITITSIVSILLLIIQIIDPFVRKARTIRLDSNEIERFYICGNKKNYSYIIYTIIALINCITHFGGWYLASKTKSVALNFYESCNIDKTFIGKNDKIIITSLI